MNGQLEQEKWTDEHAEDLRRDPLYGYSTLHREEILKKRIRLLTTFIKEVADCKQIKPYAIHSKAEQVFSLTQHSLYGPDLVLEELITKK